jgi:ribA/ribD-fused uncharacterized protein
METIKFYSTKTEYGCFSNFSKHPVDLDGKVWPTSEHYYQAQKFTDPELKEQVRKCNGPMRAAIMGRDHKLPMKQNWDNIKESVMIKVLHAKFTQNEDAKQTLLSTGDAVLIEDSPIDYYWGCGSDGTGKNRLGKLLMRLREELRNG